MILYHYSNTKFQKFDLKMCDGIWLTDIKHTDKDLLDEIGASGSRFVAVCDVECENNLVNGDNYDVEGQLSGGEYDCIENLYDGFSDYAFSDSNKVKIIEWVEL
jgi:hypothetical protein